MDDERAVRGAAFHQPRRPVALRNPEPAAFPAGIRVVDAAIESLTVEAQGVRHAERNELTVNKRVHAVEQVAGRDRHVVAEAGCVVLVDPGVVTRLDAEFREVVEPGAGQSVQRPSLRTVIAGGLRTVQRSFTLAAVELAEEQLEKRKRVFAEGDPILERTRHNLDALRSRYVKPEEALAGLRGRVDSSIGELGADHPETFTARGLLAEQLLRSGAFDESIGLLEKLLADRVRVLGVNAPATVTTSFMYGRALRECGRPEDSATHLRALVEAAPTEVTTPSPEHLQIRAELVLSLIEAGDQAGALTELQVLGMDMSHLEPTHPLREWAEEVIASLEGT